MFTVLCVFLCADGVGSADASSVVIHVSAAVFAGMVGLREGGNDKTFIAVLGTSEPVLGHRGKCLLEDGSLVEALGYAPIHFVTSGLIEDIANDILSR